MSELFIKQRSSYDIIKYVYDEIKLSLKITNQCYKELDKDPKDKQFYEDILSSQYMKRLTLLKLSNKMYGKRVTNKYICKKLEISNES